MVENNLCLKDKVCASYLDLEDLLGEGEIFKLLPELEKGWIINDLGHLCKGYNFSNFTEAMNFGNKVAMLAEKEGHHPDLAISWGKCIISIWTHKINGLTESDFILAAKIDDLLC